MEFVSRDGVRLGYEVVGSREPAMVFVHGWTSDVSCVAPQVEYFSTNHRCVAVELRGHGGSDAPEQEYTVDGFVDDVGFLCDELGVRDAVLVGHSMGGAIVLGLGAKRPDLARAIVMLDPAILFPAEMAPLLAQLTMAFEGPGGTEALRAFFAGQFFPATTEPALARGLTEAACKTPQHVIASAFKNLPAFDAEAALRGVQCPVLHVDAHPVIGDHERLLAAKPDVVMGKTVGAGHFHQLEVPEQVNAMIERFMASQGLSAGSSQVAGSR